MVENYFYLKHNQLISIQAMKFYLSLFLLLVPFFFFQKQPQPKSFEQVYYKTAVNISSTNYKQALKRADSLYASTSDQKKKLKCLMLKADVHSSVGNIKESIKIAIVAEQIASDNKYYDWHARILGFLSTQYRETGLLKRGRIYLKKGLTLSDKIENKEIAIQFKALCYQESAFYNLEEEKYASSLYILKKSDSLFNLLSDSPTKFYFLLQNEQLIAKSLFEIGSYDQSLYHYHESEKLIQFSKSENSVLHGLVYNGKGEVYLKQKKLDSVLYFFGQAEKIATSANSCNLKPLVYNNLRMYYNEVGNLKMHSHYSILHNNSSNFLKERNQNLADSELEKIDSEFNHVKSLEQTLLLELVLLFFMLIVLIVLFYKKYHKLNQKMKSIIEKTIIKKNTTAINLVPEETEKIILKKLQKFENSTKFTDKKISLSSLSTMIDTNSKYLTYVIRKNKNQDFSTYINHLRINYIVDKIQTDNNYQNYKLSYLAEECGFSSHSKFSQHFKTFVGKSPSNFIFDIKMTTMEEKI